MSINKKIKEMFKDLKIWKAIGLLITILIVSAITIFLPAYILHLVLNALGFDIGFWVCLGISWLIMIIVKRPT